MIKVDENNLMIAGELTEILTETTRLLSKLYVQLKETLGEEYANESMVKLGRLAVMSEEELEKYIQEAA